MTDLADITPSYVSLKNGNFDTRFKYLREKSGGGAFVIANGDTFACGGGGSPGGTDVAIDFRHKIGGRDVRESSGFNSAVPSNTTKSVDVGTNAGASGSSLDLSPSGISIKDSATGRLLIDPSLPIMHVLTTLNGSTSISAQNLTAQSLTAVNNAVTDLGAIDPAATHIIGAIRMAWDGGQTIYNSTLGAGGNAWYFINGTLVLIFEYGEVGVGQATNQIIGNQRNRLCTWTQYTFRANNGRCEMVENTRIYRIFNGGQLNAGGATFIRPSGTLNFKLKAAAFT